MAEQQRDQSETFGQLLRRLRLASGIHPRELARIAGVEVATFGAWERDEETPRAGHLPSLANALAVSVFDLLKRSGSLPPPSEALLEFLKTPIGQVAEANGLAPTLQALTTLRPPTVRLYTELAHVLLDVTLPSA